MEPLYTAVDPSSYNWIFVPLVIGAIAFPFIVLTPSSKSKIRTVATVASIAAFLFSGIALTTLLLISSSETNSTIANRIKLIQDTYGITISDKAYEDLQYPTKAPEEGTFSSYGTANITTKQNGEIDQSAVTLVWNETEFQLTSDENDLTQLKELPKINGD